jgi:4-amino-4-deoxy-L-arabinose transferase-like glycosyltransferase
VLTTISEFTNSRSAIAGWRVRQHHKQLTLLLIILEAFGLLVIGRRVMFDDERQELWLLTWAAGLGTFVLLDTLLTRAVAPRPAALQGTSALLGLRRWLLLGAIAPLAYHVFTDSRSRPAQDSHATLVLAWIGLMIVPLIIVSWPIRVPSFAAIRSRLEVRRFELLLITGITLGAFVLRFYHLNDQAWCFSGDEGKFAHTAREVIDGKLRNPFSTTFDAMPTLGLFVQGGFMRVFGEDIRGARMLSCLMGTATVPLLYVVVRRHFDMLTATLAAVLLATTHFHLFMSRDAMNNISTSFFMVVTLLLLDQLFDGWRPAKALLLGLMLALALYAYHANRIIIPIILTIFGLVLLVHRPRTRHEWSGAAQSLVLMAIGFGIAYLPQAAYYLDHPENFNARFNTVSILGSGWLELERERTGNGTLSILWNQFELAVLLPYTTNPAGHYQIEPPFIGWPLVIPAAIGTALITLNALRYRYLAFAVVFWAGTVGLAMTIGHPETQRFALGGLVMPLTAAFGLTTVAALLRRLAGVPRIIIYVGLAGFLAINAFWNVQVTFQNNASVNRPLDRNSEAITVFSRHMHALGPGYTIYLAAAPQMFYGGLMNLQFLTEGDKGLDLLEPLRLSDYPPVLTQPTVFYFVPEREDELQVVQAWFPGGIVDARTNEAGVELYVSYLVYPLDDGPHVVRPG